MSGRSEPGLAGGELEIQRRVTVSEAEVASDTEQIRTAVRRRWSTDEVGSPSEHGARTNADVIAGVTASQVVDAVVEGDEAAEPMDQIGEPVETLRSQRALRRQRRHHVVHEGAVDRQRRYRQPCQDLSLGRGQAPGCWRTAGATAS